MKDQNYSDLLDTFVDLNIKMIRPVPKHQVLVAEGRVINLSVNVSSFCIMSLVGENVRIMPSETRHCL